MIKHFARWALIAGAMVGAQQAAWAGHQEKHGEHHAANVTAHVRVVNTQGEEIGTAVFEQTPNGVLISTAIRGLPPGELGFHIHEKGICDPAEGFTTAGGHFAPAGHKHGFKVKGGPHAGDMPNQFVDEDGVLRAHVINSRVTLGPGANSLLDADGSSLMIHAGADDYMSQPSGDAGSRLACAVISPPKDK